MLAWWHGGRRHAVACVRMVAAGTTILFACAFALGGVNKAEALRQALQGRSDEWAADAIEGIVAGILLLESEIGPITEEQLGGIASGIGDPTWRSVITGWMHPLTRRRETLLFVHDVRQYLSLGGPDAAKRERVVEQAHLLLGQRRSELLARFPDRAASIEQAMEAVFRSLNRYTANPLKREYVEPLSEEQMAECQRAGKSIVDRLAVGEELDDKAAAFKIRGVLLRSLNGIKRLSETRTLPAPEELSRVLAEYEQRVSEIGRLESDAAFQAVVRQRHEEAMRQFLEGSGATQEAISDLLDDHVLELQPEYSPVTQNGRGQLDLAATVANPDEELGTAIHGEPAHESSVEPGAASTSRAALLAAATVLAVSLAVSGVLLILWPRKGGDANANDR